MKKTKENHDLETDDEALREAGMREGARANGKWKLRPMVPATRSIIRSNLLENRDVSWYVEAYAFCHIAPIEDVLAVEHSPIEFNKAVRRWSLENITSMEEMEELSKIVKAAYDRVEAAETRAQHASPATETSVGK